MANDALRLLAAANLGSSATKHRMFDVIMELAAEYEHIDIVSLFCRELLEKLEEAS